MKIAVIGAGAMGTLFGGRLAQAGNDVTMVDVSSAVLEEIQKDGICLEDESGMHQIPLKASKAEEIKEANVIKTVVGGHTVYQA